MQNNIQTNNSTGILLTSWPPFYLDVKTMGCTMLPLTVCKQIIISSENLAAFNIQYFFKLPFRTNYFVQHQTTVMSWCKLTNMTARFNGKSFVWSTQKQQQQNQVGKNCHSSYKRLQQVYGDKRMAKMQASVWFK